MMLDISVVVPTRNRAEFKETINHIGKTNVVAE